jgi:hypothetical protein
MWQDARIRLDQIEQDERGAMGSPSTDSELTFGQTSQRHEIDQQLIDAINYQNNGHAVPAERLYQAILSVSVPEVHESFESLDRGLARLESTVTLSAAPIREVLHVDDREPPPV